MNARDVVGMIRIRYDKDGRTFIRIEDYRARCLALMFKNDPFVMPPFDAFQGMMFEKIRTTVLKWVRDIDDPVTWPAYGGREPRPWTQRGLEKQRQYIHRLANQ